MYRLRDKRKDYISHLQKSIVDNVTNIYGILFMSAISLGSAAFGLHHAWRLSRNSGKSAEKIDPTIVSNIPFVLLAVLLFGVFLPYFNSYALRYIQFSALWSIFT